MPARPPEGVLIMAAPNGARRGKADHPALPVTLDELAADAASCREAGAAMIHVHVRDADGGHVLDAGLYARAIAGIAAAAPELMVQITTEAVGRYQPHEQRALVEALTPGAVSIALKEILPEGGDEREAGRFFAWMKARDIWPQIILYEADEVRRFFALRDRGVIPFAYPFLLFVLGRYRDSGQAEPEELAPFVEALGRRPAMWSVCAFGRREHDCVRAAITAGGHVRIGFENNLHLPDGTLAPSNAALVALAAEAARASGRGLLSVDALQTLRQRSLKD